MGLFQPTRVGTGAERVRARYTAQASGVTRRGFDGGRRRHRVGCGGRGGGGAGGARGRPYSNRATGDRRDARPHREHRNGVPAMSEPRLRVLSLYPELMNIYADRGNIAVLRARCEWRGLGFQHAASSLEESFPPHAHDLFYMGGGQDRDQAAVAHDMARTKRDALHRAADHGAVVLAVCGGYQLLGHSYQMGGEELPGVGLVDLRTVREPGERLIGNCAIESDLGTGPRVIAGFENHGGRTYLGPEEKPLGRVLSGHGNNGRDGFEGVHRGNVIGTYLHGPLPPKNG